MVYSIMERIRGMMKVMHHGIIHRLENRFSVEQLRPQKVQMHAGQNTVEFTYNGTDEDIFAFLRR